jgi:hypothetical protein
LFQRDSVAMTIDNVYSYLEYLALTVDQLADAVIEKEEEAAVSEARIQELSEIINQLQQMVDVVEAKSQLAEARAKQAEDKVEDLQLALKSANAKKIKQNAQIDLFAAPSAPPPAQSIPTKSNQVANDENALILAKKLDSTIDKVQKLIREARG